VADSSVPQKVRSFLTSCLANTDKDCILLLDRLVLLLGAGGGGVAPHDKHKTSLLQPKSGHDSQRTD
jgi:hypothetical protein